MENKRNKLIQLLTDLMPVATEMKSLVKGLSLFRIDHSFSRKPFQYNSEIIILAQGEKQVYLGNNVYTYGDSDYLVLPVPLPAECEGRVDPGIPLLGFSIHIDPLEIGEIVLDMDDSRKQDGMLPKGIYCAPMNDLLYDAAVRLLEAVKHPQDKMVLAPMIKREILYRVLQGEKGEILQALVFRNRRFFQIARVLQKIHNSYSSEFDIETLARESDMSSSTFHSSFKAVTDTSPLQYIKNVRLHKARTLMIQDGLNAGIAANEVGYESASQFNREYKRLFGTTPARDRTGSQGLATG